MSKRWHEMNEEERFEAFTDALEDNRIAANYISFLEGLLDRLADANTTFLETVQQFDVSQESIDTATGTLLDVVSEVVEKHTEEPEPREP